MRKALQKMKKSVDDKDRNDRAAVVKVITVAAKDYIQANQNEAFLVKEFNAGTNSKVFILLPTEFAVVLECLESPCILRQIFPGLDFLDKHGVLKFEEESHANSLEFLEKNADLNVFQCKAMDE